MNSNRQIVTAMRRLGPRDVARFAEAFGVLAVARVMVAAFPFHWTMAKIAHVKAEVSDYDAVIGPVVLALDRAGRRAPFRTKCFERSLAAHFMLRRRRVASRLHYGLGNVDGALAAHVWLSVKEDVVVGGETAYRFAEVASWPEPTMFGQD